MAGLVAPGSASLSFRLSPDGDQVLAAWGEVGVDVLARAMPWRTFRWYFGQRHYSGLYWSSTVTSHVIYESRLELARLLFADFDPGVSGIVAQPFLMRAGVGGVVRRHVPDFLLLGQGVPVVVDVKPRHRVDRPEVAASFAWARELVEGLGWRFEVWCEPPEAELSNIRFLAGYRRPWLFDGELLDRLRGAGLAGAMLGEALRCRLGWPPPLVRAGVLHLLWCGVFSVDLSRPLSVSHVLERAG
jgi:hypothetical protein